MAYPMRVEGIDPPSKRVRDESTLLASAPPASAPPLLLHAPPALAPTALVPLPLPLAPAFVTLEPVVEVAALLAGWQTRSLTREQAEHAIPMMQRALVLLHNAKQNVPPEVGFEGAATFVYGPHQPDQPKPPLVCLRPTLDCYGRNEGHVRLGDDQKGVSKKNIRVTLAGNGLPTAVWAYVANVKDLDRPVGNRVQAVRELGSAPYGTQGFVFLNANNKSPLCLPAPGKGMSTKYTGCHFCVVFEAAVNIRGGWHVVDRGWSTIFIATTPQVEGRSKAQKKRIDELPDVERAFRRQVG